MLQTAYMLELFVKQFLCSNDVGIGESFTELPTVLLFAGLSCIFSDCSALSCIFSLRPAFFSHLKNGLFVKSLQLVTRLWFK